jgi:hypothetical protein
LADEVKRNYLITDFLEYKELSNACKDRSDYERLIREAAEKEINLELIRTKEEFIETNYSTIFIPVKLDKHLGLIVMDTGVRLIQGVVCGSFSKEEARAMRDLMDGALKGLQLTTIRIGRDNMPDVRQGTRWALTINEIYPRTKVQNDKYH